MNSKLFATNLSLICQAISLIIIFTQNILESNGENILFFNSPMCSHSHRSGLEPLAIALAERGHNVTFYNPIKSSLASSRPHLNITEFCTKENIETNKQLVSGYEALKTRLNSRYTIGIENGTWLFDLVFKMCKETVESTEIHDLFQKSKFDMIILDKTSLGEVVHGFAYKFNITKIIHYMALSALLSWEYDFHGISSEISWAPAMDSIYQTKELTFLTRLRSEISVLSWYFGYTLYLLPKIDKMVREGLNLTDMPPLGDLVQSESLIIQNGHYSDTFPRSFPPFIVQVGGMHLQESSGILPPDLQSFLSLKDSNKSAEFIYISFGSLVQISNLPPQTVRMFLDAFKSLAPLKFMWKWEGRKLPENIPTNVLLREWFPQRDVLAHPKLRGFVTQGGQVSLQEAIFNGVPLIILPVDADQDYNAKRIRNVGNGIELEFFDMTVETIREAVNKLLTDNSYSQVASKLAIASKQRPMHPLHLAVWWTEFVLSQDDVSYLRLQTKNIPCWVSRSLDVWAFIFVAIITLLFVIFFFLYYSFKIVLKMCLSFMNRTSIRSNKKIYKLHPN